MIICSRVSVVIMKFVSQLIDGLQLQTETSYWNAYPCPIQNWTLFALSDDLRYAPEFGTKYTLEKPCITWLLIFCWRQARIIQKIRILSTQTLRGFCVSRDGRYLGFRTRDLHGHYPFNETTTEFTVNMVRPIYFPRNSVQSILLGVHATKPHGEWKFQPTRNRFSYDDEHHDMDRYGDSWSFLRFVDEKTGQLITLMNGQSIPYVSMNISEDTPIDCDPYGDAVLLTWNSDNETRPCLQYITGRGSQQKCKTFQTRSDLRLPIISTSLGLGIPWFVCETSDLSFIRYSKQDGSRVGKALYAKHRTYQDYNYLHTNGIVLRFSPLTHLGTTQLTLHSFLFIDHKKALLAGFNKYREKYSVLYDTNMFFLVLNMMYHDYRQV